MSEIKTAPEENSAPPEAESEAKQPPTTREIVAKLVDVRDERRRISTRDKELIASWDSLETELIVRLEEQGMEKASTPEGTVSINKTTLPSVTDWDEFYKYMIDNDALYLLQKRPGAAAFRELNDSGEKIDGVDPIVKKTIGLRKNND